METKAEQRTEDLTTDRIRRPGGDDVKDVSDPATEGTKVKREDLGIVELGDDRRPERAKIVGGIGDATVVSDSSGDSQRGVVGRDWVTRTGHGPDEATEVRDSCDDAV